MSAYFLLIKTYISVKHNYLFRVLLQHYQFCYSDMFQL